MRKYEKSTLSRDRKDFVALLPRDVSELVIEKLDIVGYLRFIEISKLWRSIVLDSAARQIRRNSLQQLPWLVLYNDLDTYKSEPYPGIVSLFHEKDFKLDLPELFGAVCCGSSHGWLIVATYGATFLLNPFSRRRIELPSPATFPSPGHVDAVYDKLLPKYTRKTVLLPPSNAATESYFDVDKYCTVVAIHGFGALAYCRPSDQAWIYHMEPGSEIKCVVDIIYHNGKLYGLHEDFDLLEIKLGFPIRMKRLHLPCPVGYSRHRLEHFWNEMFLVESCAEL